MSANNLGEDLLRKERIITDAIERFNLDLAGSTVFTELGSNDYLYTPIIAAVAGADSIYALCQNSRFGTVSQLKSELDVKASYFGVCDAIEVVAKKSQATLSQADIVTNSGFVRPIDQETIDMMKNTAVIPLMWETWEFRENEIDLKYARENDILVLGTNEKFLYNNNGFLATKLLFESGIGVYKDDLLILASGRLGRSLTQFFQSVDVAHDVIRFDTEDEIEPWELDSVIDVDSARDKIDTYDGIVVAEHYNDIELIGPDGLFTPGLLSEENHLVKIVHICGKVDQKAIEDHGLTIYPTPVAPFGHMTVTAAHLDSHAILELNTAGLKVGQIMGRYRRQHTFEEAYRRAIEHNLVDDFPNGYL